MAHNLYFTKRNLREARHFPHASRNTRCGNPGKVVPYISSFRGFYGSFILLTRQPAVAQYWQAERRVGMHSLGLQNTPQSRREVLRCVHCITTIPRFQSPICRNSDDSWPKQKPRRIEYPSCLGIEYPSCLGIGRGLDIRRQAQPCAFIKGGCQAPISCANRRREV